VDKILDKITVLIPARYSSTRFEGKPLAKILGKPMIYYVYSACKKSSIVDDVIVATDDIRIKECIESYGGKAVLTSLKHQSGTDRIAEVAAKLKCDIVVNAQGDEPFLHPDMITEVVIPLIKYPDTKVVTLIQKISDACDFVDVNNVKVVIDKFMNILFMSRSPIPYPKTRQNYCIYKQIGVYAFRREYLINFTKMKQTPLELIEGIELLRVMENNDVLKASLTEHMTFSVDTLSDLIEVEKLIKNMN